MINWLNFKSIKRGVTLESVLRHYQVKLRRSGKDQYRGCCPIHRGDGRDAFHVNLGRNVFHCFSCGAGGTVLDFVAAMEGCSLFAAAQRLQAMTCSSTPLTLTPNGKELVTERRKASSPLRFTLTGIDWAHPYLAERGITEETAVEFSVGFYARPGLMHGRLVIPIHNAAGELVAYCGRSVDQTQPRYRVPPAFAKSEILFNLHRELCGRGGGFLRLHESAPSRCPVGRRANGIGPLRTSASGPSGEIRPCHPLFGRRLDWPQSEHHHRSKVTATLPCPSGSATGSRSTGPVAGEGYRKYPAAVRQRRLAVR